MNFKKLTIEEYTRQLSKREPVPGGGSAAALSAALGAGLISMVTRYSIGRKNNTAALEKRLAKILRTSESIRERFLELITLDSQAYLKVAAARTLDAKAGQKSCREAAGIGKEICRLCCEALELTPFLISKGNPHLISDIEAAVELLEAGFNCSMIMLRANQ